MAHEGKSFPLLDGPAPWRAADWEAATDAELYTEAIDIKDIDEAAVADAREALIIASAGRVSSGSR